ncbi:hypothetical protein FACS189472_17310 [Alphaproteobacteria bacterium]|nr:hypothetical protein FACS189472_17310 [Alphaproteobacteria bacterium]
MYQYAGACGVGNDEEGCEDNKDEDGDEDGEKDTRKGKKDKKLEDVDAPRKAVTCCTCPYHCSCE